MMNQQYSKRNILEEGVRINTADINALLDAAQQELKPLYEQREVCCKNRDKAIAAAQIARMEQKNAFFAQITQLGKERGLSWSFGYDSEGFPKLFMDCFDVSVDDNIDTPSLVKTEIDAADDAIEKCRAKHNIEYLSVQLVTRRVNLKTALTDEINHRRIDMNNQDQMKSLHEDFMYYAKHNKWPSRQ